ncbi:MAG TPA: O-antigen ligase family protein [Parachlamydiaceae bacterium]|nr:O-antigen ligase family protein [Parachlamydiaceae bacterium]
MAALKSLHWIFLLPYFVMIFAGLMMPSDGNHGIMSLKSMAFLGSVFSLFSYLALKESFSYKQLKLFGFATAFCLFLFVWLLFGMSGTQDEAASAIDQFKIFIVTIFFVIMTLYIASESFVKEEKLIRLMIFSNFAYSCLKLIVIALHLLGFINMFAWMESIGMRFMSMEMSSSLSRFQTSVDIATPFFILFVLQSKPLNLQFGNRFKYIYFFISAVSILFSFSRFLMAVGILSVVLFALTLNKKGFLKALIIAFFCIALFILAIGPDTFFYMVERRLFSSDNYHSDLVRKEQIDALMGQFYESPYFGTGLGGYVKNLVRDGTVRHSYEVQWVAFLMQFGLVGMLFLLIPVCFIGYQFFSSSFSRVDLSFFLLFLVWLFSGFTNPFLISLASGIIYSLFLLAAKILKNKEVYCA